MEASIVDIRYKTKEILKALDKNETVKITYHGKLKGIICPASKKTEIRVTEHPFFASQKTKEVSVAEEMNLLRGDRYDL